MKVAIIFIVLLAILLPLMGIVMGGDGTLKGKLQTFTSYGLSLTNFLLCILAIVTSAYTLSSDLKRYLLFTVITKPIRRYELLIGKLVGLVILHAGLLAVFGGLIYGLAVYIPRMSDANSGEMQTLRNEFFTARAGIEPEQPDIDKLTAMAFEQLKKENRVPKDIPVPQFLAELRNQMQNQSRAVPAGAARRWRFDNVKPENRDGSIFVRFKYEVSSSPPDGMVMSRWEVGDLRQRELGLPRTTPIYEIPPRKDKTQTFHEIEIPAQAVALDGHIDIVFENAYLNQTVVIFLEGTPEILYKADSFAGNFFRAGLMIMARLIFFLVLGLSASAWLSFPIVVLVSLVVFFTGSVSGFVLDSFDYVAQSLSGFFRIISYVVYLFPRLDGVYSPTTYIVSSKMIEWGFVGQIFLLLVIVKAGLLIGLGIWVFHNREIAKISV